MPDIALDELYRLREVLEGHITEHPVFATSLEALPLPLSGSGIPEEIICMLKCGQQSQTGPMSAVAGLFAEYVGARLVREFDLKEVLVENGGDLYLKNCSELISVIHAGNSPLSDKMAFAIPPGTSCWIEMIWDRSSYRQGKYHIASSRVCSPNFSNRGARLGPTPLAN